MVIMLVGTPFFIVTIDSILSILITSISGDGKVQLSQQEINQLKTVIGTPGGDGTGNSLFYALQGFAGVGGQGDSTYFIHQLYDMQKAIDSIKSTATGQEQTDLAALSTKIQQFITFFGTATEDPTTGAFTFT
jgi:hypothetical protein